MLKYLASYVPAAILRQISGDPRPAVSPTAATFPAAVLFADISGFTTLAERLAQRGPIGAEELTRSLDTVFDLLIDLVDSAGGEVVKFAGDALLALWPTEADHLADAACRAIQAALAMHARLAALQRLLIQAPLTLRIGIGAGDVTITTLGGVRGRWDALVAGEPLTQVSTAEAQAHPGQIAVSPQVWAMLAPRCGGEPLADGGALIDTVDAPLPLSRSQPPLIPADASDAVRAFIPGAVLSQLRESEPRWTAELRRISVLFIGLPNLGQDVDYQQSVICALQTALYRFEGSINKLSVDDKGATLVAALGLPPLAHEDDAERALRAALAAQRAIEELGGHCVIGIASGRVFCGAIGNDLRREYTMIGDVVNLAARLMQAAQGVEPAILCDDATAHAARGQIELEALAPIIVKGKAQPVAVFRPVVRQAAPMRGARPRMTVVGRAEERARLWAALDTVQSEGRSQVVVVEGDAGMGKSWLIADLVREAAARRISVFTGGGHALEQSTPYFAWRNIFSQIYDIDVLSDPAARRRHMLDLLELEPDLLRWAPLLNTVLPLDLPNDAVTSELSDAARADQTRQMLVGCIQASTERSPKVIILDDMHWSDSASWALAEQIARGVSRLLLIIAARPTTGQPFTDGIVALRACADLQLHLDSLSRTDMRHLIGLRLGVAFVPEPVVDLIWRKAQGNPFYSAELAYALRDAGLLQIDGERCTIAAEAGDLHTLGLPDTLQAVITSRIDRLSPAQQLTLKTASVIGLVFAERALQAIYPVERERAELGRYLQALELQDMTLPEPLEPEAAYRFKHAITQEVVYDLMLFAQRRALHRSLAIWYEHIYADDLERYYELLAHHWNRAGDATRAIDYLERAAQQALGLCAYREARSLFEQAVELAPRLSPPQPIRQIDLHYALGEACWFQGDMVAARETLEAALTLGRRFGSESQVARILSRLARVYDDIGDLEQASAYLAESYVIATRIDDQTALVGILRNLGNEAMLRGRMSIAERYWLESLSAARRIGDRRSAARALGNLGWGCYLQGRAVEAREWLREAITIADEIGDRWVYVDCLTTLGLSMCEDDTLADGLGDAQSTLVNAFRTSMQVGALSKAVFALAGLARWRERTDQPEAAVELASFVLSHPVRGSDARMVATAVLDRLRTAILPAGFAAAQITGERLSLEEITQGLPRE